MKVRVTHLELVLLHHSHGGSNLDQPSQQIEKQHPHQDRTQRCKFHIFASDHCSLHQHETLKRTTSELTEAALLQGFRPTVSSSVILLGLAIEPLKTEKLKKILLYLWRIRFNIHKEHISLQTWFDKVHECSGLNQIHHIIYDHDVQKLKHWRLLRVQQKWYTAFVSNINNLRILKISISKKAKKWDEGFHFRSHLSIFSNEHQPLNFLLKSLMYNSTKIFIHLYIQQMSTILLSTTDLYPEILIRKVHKRANSYNICEWYSITISATWRW